MSTATIPPTMKAVVVKELGGPECLTIVNDHPTPELKPGYALVQNEYAGLNFIDTYFRKGLYKCDVPFVAGQEGGGIIVALSGGDDEAKICSLKVGDRVAYGSLGSYAQYTLVPLDQLVPVPENVAMDVAVSCSVQGLTAHYLASSVHCGMMKEGDWCLIFSVGSGTCQWAAQMAKLRGYKVIGTCSKGKADLVKAVGACDELIVLDEAPGASYADYESVDIVAKVMEITKNKGVKCILDGVGKSTVDISLSCLASRGLFVSFGNASGAAPAFPVLRLAPKSAFVTRPKLKDYIASSEELSERWNEIMDWLETKKLQMSIDRVFPLESAADGHIYMESGKSKGKILYKI